MPSIIKYTSRLSMSNSRAEAESVWPKAEHEDIQQYVEVEFYEDLVERIKEAEMAMAMGAFHHSSCGNNWYAEPGVSNKPMPCTCSRIKVTDYFKARGIDEKALANG